MKQATADSLYNTILAWEDIMHICLTTQGIDKTYRDNDMNVRQNIRCMQMFAGAFMYAAGNHIGIGAGSCAGMVAGKPVVNGNQLFGWGIAHEIGHNMDKLGKAEITNNIYALMVQTYDGDQGTLPSRLEKSGKYAAAFQKTAQGYPGAAGNISTEDVLNMCDEMGIQTGVDILKVMELSRTLRELLGHDMDSYILRAGRARDLILS